MSLSQQREELYKEIEESIQKNPLIKYAEPVPNKNRVWIKDMSNGQFGGGHYEKGYLQLYKNLEEDGAITPGQLVLETTSGTAGRPFAAIGKKLGYHCLVAMPAGGEKAREQGIKEHLQDDSDLLLTDPTKYVNGFMRFVKRFLVQNNDVYFLNHSMGSSIDEVNDSILKGFEHIAQESLDKIRNIDYFMPGVGNGTSILGPGQVLKQTGTKTIGYEPFQAALAYDLIHPGNYEEQYGIKPGTLNRSMLPGMSFSIKGEHVPVPHIKTAIQQEILEDVILMSGPKMDEEYRQVTGRDIPKEVPRWHHEHYRHLGRSTRAGIAAAKNLSQKVHDKDILLIGYDSMEDYDDQI